MNHQVYIGLGSNLGDRHENLIHAMDLLKPEVNLTQSSSIYETAPWGYQEQPAFLNCVIAAVTGLSPQALLKKLKEIEATMGRQPSFRYGPRVIDLDILLYDDLVLSTGELNLPHPRIPERAFVLVPLAEIAGERRMPPKGETIYSLLDRIDKKGIERYNAERKTL